MTDPAVSLQDAECRPAEAVKLAIEGRPWAESKAGKPITANGLARMLAPFRIVPDTIRVGDRTPKGYQRAHFDDAFTPLSAARGHLKRNTATTAMAQGLFTKLWEMVTCVR